MQAPLFTLILDSGQHGVFGVGGIPANIHHPVRKEEFDSKFPWIGHHQDIKRHETLDEPEREQTLDATNRWKWLKLHDSEGWWNVLMNELWVNGVKISKNQPVVLDVCTFPLSAGSLI
jgi:hypothetical protein